ncbi:hypothetical protein FOA43_004309 [Brettanomyces nanus]|uniref:Uncharacterized protein n=1 Tax=Eeniella nana TaxID=13502 RepID=A0A875S9Y0_EENNA|nr:uncharacterized protein FOA43_004309 [Brettanomyces nanus]QPG76915.1 hypothetical protein FOA43_004309 [Brettanomyces nanus]
MRSFMKVHLRNSASSLDKESQTPNSSTHGHSHDSPSLALMNSSIVNADVSTSSSAITSTTSSPIKKLLSPIRYPKKKHSTVSLPGLPQSSPKLVTKSSFTSLTSAASNGTSNASGGTGFFSRLKQHERHFSGELGRVGFDRHSLESNEKPVLTCDSYSFNCADYMSGSIVASVPTHLMVNTSATDTGVLESPTTIFGTKTHTWGFDDGSNTLHPGLVKPPIPVKLRSFEKATGATGTMDSTPDHKNSVSFVISAKPKRPKKDRTKRYGFVEDDDVDGEDDGNDDDEVSLDSDTSSQFSFQAGGRNASIKYYKSKDQIRKELEEDKEKQSSENFMQFINSCEPLNELDDDMNYVDFDARDDTDDLFNRRMFSDDDEDGEEEHEASSSPKEGPSAKLDSDDGPVPSSSPIDQNAQISMLLQQLRGSSIEDKAVSSDAIDYCKVLQHSTVPEEAIITELPQQTLNVLERETNEDGESCISFSEGKPQSELHPSSSDSVRYMHSGPPRIRSLKYNQIGSDFEEDNLNNIKNKYSWLPGEERNKSKSIDDNDNEYMAQFPSVDSSMLDEVNEIPDEYDYEVNYDDQGIKCGNSHDTLSRSSSAPNNNTQSGLVAAGISGNRISLNEKTITLFNPISPPSESKSPENIQLSEHAQIPCLHPALRKHYYTEFLNNGGRPLGGFSSRYDEILGDDNHDFNTNDINDEEDEFTFFSPKISDANIGESSFLTTITEASNEDFQPQHQ